MSTAVPSSAVARVLGIQTEFVNLRGGRILYLPQRVALIGQGSTAATYSLDKAQYTSAVDVGNAYGFGSPLHLSALELLPINGDGIGSIPLTVYPLEDAVGAVTASGSIIPSGSATGDGNVTITVNNIFGGVASIESGDDIQVQIDKIVAAMNAQLDIPLVGVDAVTQVTMEAKWAGTTGNDIYVEVEYDASIGVDYPVVQPNSGSLDPTLTQLDAAFAQFGEVWETAVVNCLYVGNSSTLDAFQQFGEARWGALTRRPFVSFVGAIATTVAEAIAVPDARASDYVNAQIVAPASTDLPFQIAARAAARVVTTAQDNPPQDYGSRRMTGITPGPDADQWDYAERQQAVLGGSSTTVVKDSVVTMSDTITMFHPAGDPTPAFRYVVDVMKVMNILYNIELIFSQPEWDGAPLIPDDQATVNPDAKQPKAAKAAVAAMIDSLALNAIVSDPATAKESITAQIDPQNPKRLNIVFQVQLSGNTNIISVDFNFGFFFGAEAA